MRRFYPLAILVIILAGLFGSLLSGAAVPTHVRNYALEPAYRTAVALEEEWAFLDVQGIGLEEFEGKSYAVAYLSSTDYSKWTAETMNEMAVDTLNALMELDLGGDILTLSFVDQFGNIAFDAYCEIAIYDTIDQLEQCLVYPYYSLTKPNADLLPWVGRAPFTD
jgi:hypothetical protein